MLRELKIFSVFLFLFSSLGWSDAKLKVNDAFPSVSLKKMGTFAKGSEAKGTFSQYKGKVVIVDFWASWCEPCKKELPVLNALYKKYQTRGLVVVGVNEDTEEAAAVDFLKDAKVDFALFHDEASHLANDCGLATMPSSFVLDKKGKIKFIHLGYRDGDADQFEKEVKSQL